MLTHNIFYHYLICVGLTVMLRTVAGKATDAVVRTEDFSSCEQYLTCFHGKCTSNFNEPARCVCEDGWVGLTCNQGNATPTSKPSGVIQDLMFPRPLVHSDANVIPDVATNNNDGIIDDTKSSVKIYNVCDESYTRRPVSERRCVGGLVCSFGICEMDESNAEFLAFTCRCDQGAIGVLCTHKCCKACGPHGRCFLTDNGTEMCDCNRSHTGEFCQIPRIQASATPKEEENPSIALLVAIAVTSVLAVALVMLVPFILWKLRTLGVLKLLRFFQRYEDDAVHSHDVLVCYDKEPESEAFVLQELVPQLNNMSLQVSLYILSEQKVDGKEERLQCSIESSRRVILVSTQTTYQMSPCEQELLINTSKQGWNRLACIHKACKAGETSPTKQNKHPLKNLGLVLKYPLDNNTAVRKRFWKYVEVLMPKKKPAQLNEPWKSVQLV